MTAPDPPPPGDTQPGWSELLRGRNLLVSLALSGGVAMHAVNLYLATTILPSVVREIGGIEYYAWNTTVYVVASIVGAAVSSRLLGRMGARGAYALAAGVFALASLACALAASMPVLLAGRTLQGLAGGALVALPYAMVRIVFAERLWPRALAMVSGMWGIATLLGPALGGVFAELGMWRAAFWSLVPLIAVFAWLALRVLPGRTADGAAPAPLPVLQLLVLTAAVLAASVASVSASLPAMAAWLAVGAGLMAAFVRAQHQPGSRLLPRGSFRISSPLGGLYAMSVLLAVTVTCTEIFVPLFLQSIHGSSPLMAGYIAALMSVGWTTGSLLTSGLQGTRRTAALRAAPLLALLATAALAVLMPLPSGQPALMLAISAAMVTCGFGVGIAYPHLSAQVLTAAPPDEPDLAASSIMTVQLCATAFGAALAGLVVNLVGRPVAGGSELDAALASRWLFALFALAPALCLRLIWPRAARM
ncbi:MAG: MFS transporter [Xanthomonadales bacterium]|nr:MFS transporter [Xanthomonadales bacterium]